MTGEQRRLSELHGEPMRFFFNLAGAVYDLDNSGHELASVSVARTAAVKFGAEYLRDRPEVAWLVRSSASR